MEKGRANGTSPAAYPTWDIRCRHLIRQCARSAGESGEGVEGEGETGGACSLTKWLRGPCIQARRG